MSYGLSFTDKIHIVTSEDKPKLGGRWMRTLCNSKGMNMGDDVPQWKVQPQSKDMCRLCRRIVLREP
jgi:hypothetical protein